MKKLMFAAALATAMTGFSDVNSSNIVGYMNSDCVTAEYTASVGAFDNVGDKAVSLTDLTVSGDDCSQNLIQFLTPNGRTKKHILTEEEKVILDTTDNEWEIVLYYVSKKECDEWQDGTTPGWYFQDDRIMLLNVSERGLFDKDGNNEVDVAFGKGFLFRSGGTKFQLLSSGEVVKGNSEVITPLADYTVVGNASPVDRDLGYFTVTGDDCSLNLIQFLTSNGRTKKWKFSDEEKAILDTTDTEWEMVFYYVSKAECDEWQDGTTPGWYFQDDRIMLLNMSEKITVKAGQGFLFRSGDAKTKLVVPGALEANEE